MRACDSEGGHHRLAGVEVAGAGDLDVGGGRNPAGQELIPELLGRLRRAQAWGPAGIAYHVASRPFLTGLEAAWIDRWRRRLKDVRLRGLECFAAAGLGLGGPALAQAEERARMLTELAPYRETGYRLLMEALARRGNTAEALRAYDRLRVLLREELGIAPSPAMQVVHRSLLQSAGG